MLKFTLKWIIATTNSFFMEKESKNYRVIQYTKLTFIINTSLTIYLHLLFIVSLVSYTL